MTSPVPTSYAAPPGAASIDPASPLAQLARGVTLITGTDTDVGKTVATAVLAAALERAGVDLALVKPAQTGLAPDEDGGDVELAGELAGLDPQRRHEYVRLPEPLAPTTAARRAGVALPTVAEHARRLQGLLAGHDALLVEGAGGILVGLDGAGDGLLELADALRHRGVPTRFVVVTRAGLGTLNHSALTCRAIRARGHDLAGLIVGSVPPAGQLAGDAGLAERCNLAELPAACDAPVLAVIPAGIGQDAHAVRRTAAALAVSTGVPVEEGRGA